VKTAVIIPLILAAAAPALAASPFDGTWKTDLKTIKFDPKPDQYLLARGIYKCITCIPPIDVPADGKFHPITGHDYADAFAVKVDGPRGITTMAKRGGKLVGTSTMTISPDGKTVTYAYSDTADNGVKTTGSSTAMRVAAAPAGAHMISGSWKAVAAESASASGTSMTIKLADGTLAMSAPTGETYAAKLGGPAVLQQNDPGKTMIRVRQLGPNRIVEEDSRHGKLVSTFDMTLAPGGRTMMVASTDKRDNTTAKFTMVRQ
jgi:hypothetical protein